MVHKIHKFKTVLVLAGLVGAWLLLMWAVPATGLDASNWVPALLTFQSPIGNPALTLSKTANKPAPKAGEDLAYTLTYANVNSGGQAFNVRLYDFLPAGVELLYTVPLYDTYEDGVLTFNAATVGPGTDPLTFTVYTRVREGYTSLNNQALVMADGVTPTYASLLSTVYPPRRELTLSKTGYNTVLKDSELIYQLRCENTGDISLQNIVILDILPAGVTYQAATPSPDNLTAPIIQWNVGNLAVGNVWTATLQVTSPAEAGTITNTLIASAEQLTPTHQLFATNVISTGAILLVDKMGSAQEIHVGEELVYTLAYENIGNVTANAVVLIDTYPADITVTGFSPTPDSTDATQAVWQLGAIGPSESGQVVMTTTIGGVPGRILHNVADIDDPAPDAFGDQATLDTPVIFYRLYLPLMVRQY